MTLSDSSDEHIWVQQTYQYQSSRKAASLHVTWRTYNHLSFESRCAVWRSSGGEFRWVIPDLQAIFCRTHARDSCTLLLTLSDVSKQPGAGSFDDCTLESPDMPRSILDSGLLGPATFRTTLPSKQKQRRQVPN